MNKKIFIIAITFFLSTSLGFDANAQTRRARKPMPRRPATAIKRRAPPVKKSVSAAVTTFSGLTYLITKRGVGRQPKIGETVVVHYTGMLTNGVKFDSSHDRAAPIVFKLGAGRVIKGWDEGIAKLRVGDQAILVIPANLGYGKPGTPDGTIPPDATLIFIVELVDIETSAPGENP
ncbi:MAG: FKBP-type peptidyl-prolyl cis-trans isomerase [Acidobacteriota bacterium]|nr:FKBP-type peptidyl-prolyl cis-trans isomerase [Acidobacteriota bacterium]